MTKLLSNRGDVHSPKSYRVWLEDKYVLVLNSTYWEIDKDTHILTFVDENLDIIAAFNVWNYFQLYKSSSLGELNDN